MNLSNLKKIIFTFVLISSFSSQAGPIRIPDGITFPRIALFSVNTTDDTSDADLTNGRCKDSSGNCSLRAAVEQANATSSRYEIITVPEGDYILTEGDLDITTSMAIKGSDRDMVIIHASEENRIFTISSAGSLNLSGVTLTGGSPEDGQGGLLLNRGGATLSDFIATLGNAEEGSALFNSGLATMTLSDCEITNNTGTSSGYSGAIYNNYSLTISDCDITENVGGGISNSISATDLTISSANISNNTGESCGGISSWAYSSDTPRTISITISSSTISENTITEDGGAGIFIYEGNLEISDTTISGNDATDSSASGGGIFGSGDSVVTLSGTTTVSDNTSTESGGGILVYGTLNTNGVEVSGNSSAYGGGIAVNEGTLNIVDSQITDNISTEYGGGLFIYYGSVATLSEGTVVSNNEAPEGGGIAIFSSEITATDLTVSENTATTGNGGGVYVVDDFFDGNRVTLSGNNATEGTGGGISIGARGRASLLNSTIYDNEAMNGGGIYNDGDDASTYFSTIAENRATTSGGGIYAGLYSNMNVYGSLIADNEASSEGDDCYEEEDFADLVSLGYNGISTSENCSMHLDPDTDEVGSRGVSIDFEFDTFENHGGETETYSLLSTSSAIDIIPLEACVDSSGASLTQDQRGEARADDSGCDKGAFEY